MTGRHPSMRVSAVLLCLALALGVALAVVASMPRAASAVDRQEFVTPERGGGGSGDVQRSGDDDQPTMTGRKDQRVLDTVCKSADGETQGTGKPIRPEGRSGMQRWLDYARLLVQLHLGVQR